MAIHGKDGGFRSAGKAEEPQTKTTQEAPQQAAQPQVSQPQQPVSAGTGPSLFGEAFATLIPKGTGSEYTAAFAKMLDQIFDQAQHKPKIIALDNQQYDIAYSCIVVALKDEQSNNVPYHILLLENTGEHPQPVSNVSTDRRALNEEFVKVSINAFDSVLESLIVQKVLPTHFGTDVTFISTDGMRVPYTVQPNEANKELMTHIAYLVGTYLGTEVAISNSNFRDLSISKDMSAGNAPNLSIEVDVNRHTEVDDVGEPIYVAWSAQLTSQPQRNARVRSINLSAAHRVILRVTGAIDVIPYQMAMPPVPGMMANQTVVRFAPHIILDYASLNAYTPASVQLAVAIALAMRTEGAYMGALAPSREDDLHDPGYLNIIANLNNEQTGIGKPIDFFDSALDEAGQMKLLKELIPGGPVVSIDVPVYGPLTYPLHAFSLAAEGDANAEQLLIAAANQLTSNMFSRYFEPGKHSVVSKVAYVPNGYFTDNNGRQRDLREINNLAVIKMAGEGNANMAYDFAVASLESNLNTNPMATVTLIEVLKNVVPQAVITGWNIRCTLSAEYLSALEHGIHDAGFAANINAPTFVQGLQDIGAATQFVNNAMLQPGVVSYMQQMGGTGPSIGRYWTTPGGWRS